MRDFIYTGLPSRVIFGSGTVGKLKAEAEALGIGRALILTTPEQVSQGEMLNGLLGQNSAGIFSNAAMHTPVDVTDEAIKAFDNANADGVISIGGGSTIGLGKAIALRNDASQIALPTTYAGSEMTTIIGQTQDGVKTTQKTLKVLPETVIYDVDFTLSLPAKMSVTSGINAIAHAVEALYAENANPLLSLMAQEGIAALMRALPVIIQSPQDREARTDAAYGAWLCAVCLATGGVALHHKLCHILGGTFNLPHAETHSIVLPHAIAYNAPALADSMPRLQQATMSDNPAGAIFDLLTASGSATSLKELSMPEDGIDEVVRQTLANPYWNPQPLEAGRIKQALQAAWAGERPEC